MGKVIQEVIESAGFRPIENLTGHEIKPYNLHAGLTVPNIEVPYNWEIKEGMVIAIEPFATNGYGRVVESRQSEIFSLLAKKPTRMKEGRVILSTVEKERRELPFASRWFITIAPPAKLNLVLNRLVSEKALKAYPVLHEKERGVVSQFEHTVIVTSHGCEVTTL